MYVQGVRILLSCMLAVLVASKSPTCTTQYGSVAKGSVPTSTSTSTIRTTLTESIIYVTHTITSGTTTIPTPNGFTPILSETTSVAPGPHIAADAVVSANGHATASSYPASVICSTSTTLTVTQMITSGRAASTITSTATSTVPTATFYAACAANNIVDQGQGTGYGHAIEFESEGTGNLYRETEIVNSTAYDCCVACQTTYPCTFSSLSTYYGQNPPVQPNCFLYTLANGTCNGGESVGPAEYYYDPASSAGPGQAFIVSNGACGQIIYGGAF